jgi:hypothetical protein
VGCGTYSKNHTGCALIEHWDGTSWTIQPFEADGAPPVDIPSVNPASAETCPLDRGNT